ncbi:histidine phosphotransferase family protein [Hyphomicrobiales bacterium]|jgi:histidine phosphotransferase ChpT|nr:histidine phosphotransferase family protein [Hyphomicrobiales bacterium]|tara:strand:+ start:4562 stop:5197 length:636 start_codon:yes stop_codon:yes gene_type:complete
MNKHYTEIELITLLCSKLCHDLINPISAALNGCEMIDENINDETNLLAESLVRKSLQRASSQISLYRVAFGVFREDMTSLENGELFRILNLYNDNKKIKLELDLDNNLLKTSSVRLILNLYLVSLQLLPRGGNIVISDKNSTIQAACYGNNFTINRDISNIFTSEDIDIDLIDTKLIQILFTKLIVTQLNKKIFLKELNNKEGVIIEIKSL